MDRKANKWHWKVSKRPFTSVNLLNVLLRLARIHRLSIERESSPVKIILAILAWKWLYYPGLVASGKMITLLKFKNSLSAFWKWFSYLGVENKMLLFHCIVYYGKVIICELIIFSSKKIQLFLNPLDLQIYPKDYLFHFRKANRFVWILQQDFRMKFQ